MMKVTAISVYMDKRLRNPGCEAARLYFMRDLGQGHIAALEDHSNRACESVAFRSLK